MYGPLPCYPIRFGVPPRYSLTNTHTHKQAKYNKWTPSGLRGSLVPRPHPRAEGSGNIRPTSLMKYGGTPK